MKRDEILEKVNEVFNDVLEKEVLIKEEDSSNDIDGWDSLTHIMLIVGLKMILKLSFFQVKFLIGIKLVI